MHMLPVLGALAEKRAGQPLAIIGVHSAKFDNEKVPSHVRAAVARYGIDHPVVVDNDMAIWDRYGVQAWPTLVLIRPNGHIAGAVPGEVTLGMLDHAVKEIMADAKADGTLGTTQLLPPHVAKPDPGLLAYPGKVIAAPDGRIFLSDSRHHRVLELGHDGRVIDIIGSGELGRQAGPFATAQLDDPQGLAFDRGAERLYIADGRGQTIWKADLRGKTLTVLAGSGKLGSSHFAGDEDALGAELRTPWDLALAGQKLYVAMAGAHQLAVIDLGHGTIAGFAGNGRETLVDGSGPFSSFAQPSGLAIGMLRPAASARQPAEPASSDDGETMYVADSESSAIRAVDLRSGETKTIVGTGLFDWGDKDGPLGPQMLQHPLAVAWSKGGLWIADSYNNKVKRFSPAMDSIATVVSDAEGQPLAGPAGLAVEADGSLLIADTDRSRLLRLRPGATEAKRVPVRPPGALATADETAPVAAPSARKLPDHTLPARQLPDGTTSVHLALLAPAGFAFSDAGPWSVDLTGDGALALKTHSQMGESKVGDRVDIPIELAVPGPGTLHARVHASVCDAINHAACYPLRENFTVALSGGGQQDASLDLPLSAPGGGTAKPR
jgi:DNA-binding beta-propeller fold protein YncE